MKKRIISIMLVVILLIQVFPMEVNAQIDFGTMFESLFGGKKEAKPSEKVEENIKLVIERFTVNSFGSRALVS